MLWVGGNAQEEKQRFIVQDSMRGHGENRNTLAMTASPQGPAETQSCQLPLYTETLSFALWALPQLRLA